MHYWDFSDVLHFSKCVCITGVFLMSYISGGMYALLGFF